MDAKTSRLTPWIIAAVLCAVALVLLKPDDAHVVLSKAAMLVSGAVLGFLVHHTLMPYNRPSGYLVTPWELSMIFKPGEADHRIVPGYEWQFLAACILRVACIVGGAFVMGLGI